MGIYFSDYSDDEIEKMIERLTIFQKRIFDSKLQELYDRRQALLIAKSYPDNYEGKI